METYVIVIIVLVLLVVSFIFLGLILASSNNNNDDNNDDNIIIGAKPIVSSVNTDMDVLMEHYDYTNKMVATFLLKGSNFTSNTIIVLDSGDITTITNILSTEVQFTLTYEFPKSFNTNVYAITEYGNSSKIPFVFGYPTISNVTIANYSDITITGTNIISAVAVMNYNMTMYGFKYTGTTSVSYTGSLDKDYPVILYTPFGYYDYFLPR